MYESSTSWHICYIYYKGIIYLGPAPWFMAFQPPTTIIFLNFS